MARVAHTVCPRSDVGLWLPRIAPLVAAGLLAILSGACTPEPRRSSSPALPQGTFLGPEYTEPAKSGVVVNGRRLMLTWRPAVRITPKTITFGRAYVGPDADGADVPASALPKYGHTEYSTVHEYGVLEEAGNIVTIRAKLASGFNKRLRVELKGRDVIIEGIQYSAPLREWEK